MFDFAFNSFYEAIYMNGHGIYVWSVVAIVCISLFTFFILYSSKIKQIKKKLNEPNWKEKSLQYTASPFIFNFWYFIDIVFTEL